MNRLSRTARWTRRALLLSAAIAVQACSDAPANASPAETALANPIHRCINLGNALEASYEGEWGYKIEEPHFDLIAEAGFDTVRVPIAFHNHALADEPYTIDAGFMARVQEVVDQALARELNVIVDLHHYDALIDNPYMERPRALAIWRQIAEAFKDAPDTVLFELLNEPRGTLSGATWDVVLNELHAAVRESNPDRWIIIGGDNWNSIEGLMNADLPDDPAVITTFHYYEPFNFTHQAESWMDNPPPKGRTFGSDADLHKLRRDAALIGNWREKDGRPMLLGEFGVSINATPEQRLRWWRAVSETFTAYDMATCVWAFQSTMPIYDTVNGDWLPGVLDALDVEPREKPAEQAPSD